MQEIEKTEMLTKLEELNLSINEKPLNYIGIHICKFKEILSEYKLIKNFVDNYTVLFNQVVKNEDKRAVLRKLYDYLKDFSNMSICKNYISETNKNSIEGTLSSLIYSNKIGTILSCIIKDSVDIFLLNFDGIINFYCKIIFYSCGSLINQNIDTGRMLVIQNELSDLEKELQLQFSNADFKVFNFAKDCLNFSQNTIITNKIYQISLLKIIEEVKKYVDSLDTNADNVKTQYLLTNLTNAENALFNYLIKGYTISKIANIMNKSNNTLKTQQQSIFNKLNVNSKNELIEKFTQNG